MTRILVVRHGQSEWNADGRWQGQENPPLTDLGRQQARRAASSVGVVEAVYASPLDRATTTAHLLSEEVGIGPVLLSEGLMERHAGEWQGLTRNQIEEQYPGYLDSGRRPPGWEDDGEVERRVMAAMDEIAVDQPEGDVLAVAHAGVIYALERVLDGTWERLANLAGRWIDDDSGQWRLGDRVHLLVEETVPDQI